MTPGSNATPEPPRLASPTTEEQRTALLDALWARLPQPLRLQLGHHTMTFRPAGDGTLTTGPHDWGPLRVQITISARAGVSIAPGRHTVTNTPLDTKQLLDLADRVHDALMTHAHYGPVYAATRAVANQRIPATTPPSQWDSEAQSDAAVTARALARLPRRAARRSPPE